MKEIAIVGAGISGLYAALLLVNQGCRVTVLEKDHRIGGRIHTVVCDGVNLEAGAGRFNENHKLLWDLLHDCGFVESQDFYPLSGDKIYIKDGKRVTRFSTLTILREVMKRSEQESPARLRDLSLRAYMKEFIEDSVVDDVVYSFGYNTEFDLMNAWDALSLFKHDFVSGIQYYVLKGGLSRLVERIYEKLISSKLCTFKTSCEVVSHMVVGQKSVLGVLCGNQYEKKSYNHVVFCTTKNTLLRIKGVVDDNKYLQRTLSRLGSTPLLRMYARFPMEANGKVWFHDMPRVTTNNLLRYIIPINPAQGIVMISYTDGYYADTWEAMRDKRGTLMRHLKKMFPGREISPPLWIRAYYWGEGVHYWGTKPVKYLNTRDRFSKYNYLVCGEAVSERHHGWIEGGLDSVRRCIHLCLT